MKQTISDIAKKALRDISKTSKNYDRAQFALANNLSLFDFDEWCHVCNVLKKDVPFEDLHKMNEFFEDWNELEERKGKPWCDWDWMDYVSEGEKDDLYSIWLYCSNQPATQAEKDECNDIYMKIAPIVARSGIWQAERTWQRSHVQKKTQVWNDDHKIVEVISVFPYTDGVHGAFQVDLVTGELVTFGIADKFRDEIRKLVNKQGGFRELKVLAEEHEFLLGETWNDDHKVVNVLSCVPEEDGYRSGFQVDLVTNSICG